MKNVMDTTAKIVKWLDNGPKMYIMADTISKVSPMNQQAIADKLKALVDDQPGRMKDPKKRQVYETINRFEGTWWYPQEFEQVLRESLIQIDPDQHIATCQADDVLAAVEELLTRYIDLVRTATGQNHETFQYK